MIKYAENKFYTLYQGEMQEVIDQEIQENSIDAIVTDPPYELNFMGKGWDNSGVAFRPDTWKRCFKALKSGGYLLAFGGTRTFHRIACAIEDAGFEIRDTIMWLYGSGFPKSMSLSKGLEAREKLGNAGTRNKRKIEQACDTEEYTLKQTNNGAMGEIIETTRKQYIPDTDLAKQWQGWGTCLKPAYEPIIVARKPFKGSCTENVMKYGVGGINIDECRVPFKDKNDIESYDFNNNANNRLIKKDGEKLGAYDGGWKVQKGEREIPFGRFPSNIILTYDDTDFDEVCGGFPNTKCGMAIRHNSGGNTFGGNNKKPPMEDLGYNDDGSAARYFYCAKASKKDRDEGLDEFEEKKGIRTNAPRENEEIKTKPRKNIHPTVKPTELMQYLIRLVTPKGGTILDPFNGSGSTGKAAMFENVEKGKDYKYIGIELTEEYLPISKARIDYALSLKNSFREELKKTTNNNDSEQKENEEENSIQLTIFDF